VDRVVLESSGASFMKGILGFKILYYLIGRVKAVTTI